MSHPSLQQWLDTPLDKASSDTDNWMLKSLKMGIDLLNIDTGIISQIDSSNYVIRQVTSNIGNVFSPGDRFELSDTYCAAVVNKNETVTYIQVGAIPEMLLHPVYKAVQLESYIGSPIHDKKGKVTGTINFSSHMIRNSEFSKAEVEFVEQLAEKLSNILYP